MNKRELHRFATTLNRCIQDIHRFKKMRGHFSEAEMGALSGIKDTVYLLGRAIDKDTYEFADGFQKFCDEFGISFDEKVPFNTAPLV